MTMCSNHDLFTWNFSVFCIYCTCVPHAAWLNVTPIWNRNFLWWLALLWELLSSALTSIFSFWLIGKEPLSPVDRQTVDEHQKKEEPKVIQENVSQEEGEFSRENGELPDNGNAADDKLEVKSDKVVDTRSKSDGSSKSRFSPFIHLDSRKLYDFMLARYCSVTSVDTGADRPVREEIKAWVRGV